MMAGTKPIFRIAPTPSGFLHAGNAWSFLLTASLAKASGGDLLLRIDDLDAERKRSEYVRDIFESLEWLGIEWQLGPKYPEDFEKNFSQKHRLHLYRDLLAKLVHSGNVFACECSRSILPKNAPYPGTCLSKNISLQAPEVSWRLKVPENEIINLDDLLKGQLQIPVGKSAGAFVVRTKQGIPAYQIASLADDLFFGVNHIVRGEDLLESTALQLFLAEILDEPSFTKTVFLHHPLLSDPDGEKLSKSAGAQSLKEIRLHHPDPRQILDWFFDTTGIEFPNLKSGDKLPFEKLLKLKSIHQF